MVVMLDIFLFCFEGAILMIKLFGADMYAELAAAEELVHRNELVQELAIVLNVDSTSPDDVAAEPPPETAAPAEVPTIEGDTSASVAEAATPSEQATPSESEPTIKRDRGRPRGAKNRPRPPEPPSAVPV
ncbi:hypothetical protein QA635_04170 [Bradyrhizobium brasilense]|uniref:hypothetical protein n=1 Tax=Bradyrhizobium brasilense TaxID=1419277 RepID=UPI0024B05E1B|nr:hypothetical protein [Bradyrhizobium australafricanum]WFU33651.1 hypothetical protein QA635_04170 [Bradyrhizobium australafricanum]